MLFTPRTGKAGLVRQQQTRRGANRALEHMQGAFSRLYRHSMESVEAIRACPLLQWAQGELRLTTPHLMPFFSPGAPRLLLRPSFAAALFLRLPRLSEKTVFGRPFSIQLPALLTGQSAAARHIRHAAALSDSPDNFARRKYPRAARKLLF